MTNDKLLSAKEVMILINKSYKTTLKYIKDGKIPYIITKNDKNRDVYMVKDSVVKKYLDSVSGNVEQPPSTTSTIKLTPKQTDTKFSKGEVELLRQRVSELEMDKSFLVSQIQVKDEQITSFSGIVERLQQTNQYLLLENGRVETSTTDITPEPEPKTTEPTIQDEIIVDIEPAPPTDIKPDKPTIEEIINKRVLKGSSDKKISKWLNKKGIPTISGKGEWYSKSVWRVRNGKK